MNSTISEEIKLAKVFQKKRFDFFQQFEKNIQ